MIEAYSERPVNLKDGNYNGTWSAYYVQLPDIGRFKVSIGLKTMIPVPCTVSILNKRATIHTHDATKK